jgi:hypothetical protein
MEPADPPAAGSVMRGDGVRTPGRQLKWAGAVAVALALVAVAPAPAEASEFSPTIRSGVLHPARLASASWQGGRYVTASGEQVTVFVSPSYASDSGAGQRWADFFASLVHGPELSLLTAYIAPYDEVQDLCEADGGALGCYWAQKLIAVGDAVDGIQPTSVAAHEYGHHVANNRSNAPWRAIDWGTKRWATYTKVCARTSEGTAFPGDEGDNYRENPGEAFAESFRILNETARGLPITWPILDPSFIPDATALQAVRDDVLQPWTTPTMRTIRARLARGRHVWRMTLATPLDGNLSIRLAQGSDDLDLLNGANTVLAHGYWNINGGKALGYQICGQRSVVIRVRTDSKQARFTLRISEP